MKIFSVCAVLACSIALGGCAKKAEDISASYVSPLQYQAYSCRQIAQEAQRVSAKAAHVSGIQDKKASNDAVATGVAVVLFWPAAFFIKGSGENAGEVARLKGELDALEQASIQKNCNIQFKKEPEKAPTKAS